MQDLGLTAADRQVYEKALHESGHFWWLAKLWKRDRTHAANLLLFQDGQVNLDTTVVTDSSTGNMWSATLTVADPQNRLSLDTKALFLDRMLRLEYWVQVAELGKAVGCAVFTGPVTKCDDTGLGLLAMEAQGKEMWARGTVKRIHHYPKGSLVTAAIRDLWANVAGENQAWLDIPAMKARLPAPFQVGPETTDGAWGAIQYLAGTIGCDAFYDGASYGHLRRQTTHAVYEFDENTIVPPAPQLSTLVGGVNGSADDPTQIINDVVILGQAKPPKNPPKGYKPPIIRGEAIAPKGNRYYPGNMGNPLGPGLFLVEKDTLDHVRLDKTAQQIAETRLRRRMAFARQAAFHSVVVPHLDPYDLCRVNTTGLVMQFDLAQRSIPLLFSADNPQTVGYTKRVSSQPPRMRR